MQFGRMRSDPVVVTIFVMCRVRNPAYTAISLGDYIKGGSTIKVLSHLTQIHEALKKKLDKYKNYILHLHYYRNYSLYLSYHHN